MKQLLTIFLTAFLIVVPSSASSAISGANGLGINSTTTKNCAGGYGSITKRTNFYLLENACNNLAVKGYVPVTGQYAVVTWFAFSTVPIDGSSIRASDQHQTSTMATIDGSIPVSEQTIVVSSSRKNIGELKSGYYATCYTLVDSKGINYTSFGPNSCSSLYNGNYQPLPQESQSLKCSLEGGNAIDVSLGDIDRSKIGTVPGSTEGISKKISMTCTGQGSGNFNYTFNYTPISVGDNQLISTSSAGHGSTSGLGVALFMNGALVKPNVAIARTYSTGTQTETLKFEPIRDPAKPATYISTGSFTASAVLIISPE